MKKSKKTNKKIIKKNNLYSELIGKAFFFRAVTYHYVGIVESVHFDRFLRLKNASWIAESGRFMNTIKEGCLNEVEPIGDMFLNIETIVDFIPWNHSLPTEQK